MRVLRFDWVGWLAVMGLVWFAGGAGAESGSGRVAEEWVESQALAANLLGDPGKRAVAVYLPPGYDQAGAKRYPVMYWLHGFKARNRLTTGPGQPGRGLPVRETADDLIKRGMIQPLIIVMPDGANAYGGSFYINSEVTGKWEDFICRDLVGFIDRTYRTIPEAGSRGLAGHSMGGYGAVILGMRHPEIFRAVYAQSPACLVFAEHFLRLQRANVAAAARRTDREQFPDLEWREQVIIAAAAAAAPNPQKGPWRADFPLTEADGQERLDEAVWQRWLQSDPYTLLVPLKANLARIRLALDMGTADKLLPQVQMVHGALERLGLAHRYEEYQGDHVSQLQERLRERVLPFMGEVLTGDQDGGPGTGKGAPGFRGHDQP